MNSRTLLGLTIAVAVGIGALAYVNQTLAQMPMGPGGPMMGPGQQMPMGQMMVQMQQQMGMMSSNLQAMRARLDRINPGLLTPAEREMYEYLKLMQSHMETMQMWAGNAQGVMRQMPAPRR